jgi:hypothetical protein
MEEMETPSNDIKEFCNKVYEDFPGKEAFFIAQYTDKFVVGNWNNDCNVNEEKLLELRIFDKDKEWKLFRSDLGREFLWRCRSEKNSDGSKCIKGEDYFDELQLLDIDTKRSSKTSPGIKYTTAGGSYYLPVEIDDIDRAAVRVRHYFGVEEDSGQAFIKDYRLVSFESAEKKYYSEDLKGENNEKRKPEQ